MRNHSQLLFDFMNDRLSLKKSTPVDAAINSVKTESGAAVAEILQPTKEPETKPNDDLFVQNLEYRVRVSARARQVLLRVQPGQGLIVTIPKRFAKRDIPAVLKEQRAWIEQNLVAMDARVPDEYRIWPPTVLNLDCCNSVVRIEFKIPDSEKARGKWQGPELLHLYVDPDDRQLASQLIAESLKTRARKLLSTRISELAQQHGFYFKKLAVRAQRSVWGSYSSSGTLSLNYKLIFLRPDLVDYVLLHELAHTRYLDHSPAFWRLVESLHPKARQLDKELNSACRHVPPWLETQN